jgi:hypothetical protein
MNLDTIYFLNSNFRLPCHYRSDMGIQNLIKFNLIELMFKVYLLSTTTTTIMTVEEQFRQAYLMIVMTVNQIWVAVEPTAKPLFDSSFVWAKNFYQQQNENPDPIKILIAIAIAIISLIVIVQQIMTYLIFGSLLTVVAYILYICFHPKGE